MEKDPILAEWAERKAAERAKALEKYGPRAIEPGGRPEFDILDFAINEVVGLERYGEMLTHRFPNTEVSWLGEMLKGVALQYAPRLIKERQKLVAFGEQMGITEQDRFTLPENAHGARTLAEPHPNALHRDFDGPRELR